MRSNASTKPDFEKGALCDDHMLTAAILQEKCRERGAGIWIAAVDVEEAFDPVSRESLREALSAQRAPEQCARALSLLRAGQTAHGRPGCRSRTH
eukprot:4560803-Pyramimonas_sp.AAC.1